jgi:hypothetical protein
VKTVKGVSTNEYASSCPDCIFCFSLLTSSFRSIPRSVCRVGDCTESRFVSKRKTLTAIPSESSS